MVTEKEKKISDENYEISKKIYNLFKKYRNYNNENTDSKIENTTQITEFNYDDLFKNRKKTIENTDEKNNIDNVSLIQYRENFFIKFLNKIKKIFKRY